MKIYSEKMEVGIYLKAGSLITTLGTLLKDLKNTSALSNPHSCPPQYGSPLLNPLSIISMTNIRTDSLDVYEESQKGERL